jgi:hypothetical protein
MTKVPHVRVKLGVLDLDFGNDMSGWSGRVTKQENDLLTIEWDGPTLRSIPDANIRYGLDQGYSINEYWLGTNDVEPAEPTDTFAETAQTLQELEDRYHDYDSYQLPSFPFATHAAFKVTDGLPRNDKDWSAYLAKSLDFPFLAIYVEGHQLPYRTEVTLTALNETTERYGILVNGHKTGPDNIVVPLADLEGLAAKKKSTKLLEWYRVWFANR